MKGRSHSPHFPLTNPSFGGPCGPNTLYLDTNTWRGYSKELELLGHGLHSSVTKETCSLIGHIFQKPLGNLFQKCIIL